TRANRRESGRNTASAARLALDSAAPASNPPTTRSARREAPRSRQVSRDPVRAARPRIPRFSKGRRCPGRASRHHVSQARLREVANGGVALETLVFQLYVLDGDGIRIGIEVGQRLIFRDPAAENLVGNPQLPRLVVDF